MENPTLNSEYLTDEFPPDNYLGRAIVSTLLCCWPLGIPAIVYAAKVDTLWFNGYKASSIRASNSAKAWSTAAIISGIFGYIVIILMS